MIGYLLAQCGPSFAKTAFSGRRIGLSWGLLLFLRYWHAYLAFGRTAAARFKSLQLIFFFPFSFRMRPVRWRIGYDHMDGLDYT